MYNPEVEYLYYECLLIILEETRGFKLEILRLKECPFLIPLIKTDVFFGSPMSVSSLKTTQ